MFEDLRETYIGDAGFAMYASVVQPTAPSILLVPGFSESFVKYDEVLTGFLAQGWNVFAMDLRGMGLSKRFVANAQIGHIDDFDEYVEDLCCFIADVVRRRAEGPLFLLGHSTGGLIVLRCLEEQKSGPVAGLILSAPLLRLGIGLPERLVAAIARTLCAFGLAKRYAPAMGDINLQALRPEHSRVTTDLQVAQKHIDLLKQFPKSLTGGPSNAWLRATLAATRQARGIGRRINVPTLLLTAEKDLFVSVSAQHEFARDAKCQQEFFPGSKHEIFMEVPAIRQRALALAVAFVKKHAKP